MNIDRLLHNKTLEGDFEPVSFLDDDDPLDVLRIPARGAWYEYSRVCRTCGTREIVGRFQAPDRPSLDTECCGQFCEFVGVIVEEPKP